MGRASSSPNSQSQGQHVRKATVTHTVQGHLWEQRCHNLTGCEWRAASTCLRHNSGEIVVVPTRIVMVHDKHLGQYSFNSCWNLEKGTDVETKSFFSFSVPSLVVYGIFWKRSNFTCSASPSPPWSRVSWAQSEPGPDVSFLRSLHSGQRCARQSMLSSVWSPVRFCEPGLAEGGTTVQCED